MRSHSVICHPTYDIDELAPP